MMTEYERGLVEGYITGSDHGYKLGMQNYGSPPLVLDESYKSQIEFMKLLISELEGGCKLTLHAELIKRLKENYGDPNDNP